MLHTFVALVEDKPGVLTRVASLFRRLNINIVSLTVGESERPDVSRMTIVCEAPDTAAHRIRASLYKLEITVEVDDALLRKVAGAFELHVLDEVRQPALVIAFQNRPRVDDEPKLCPLFWLWILTDVIPQTVGERSDRDLLIGGQELGEVNRLGDSIAGDPREVEAFRRIGRGHDVSIEG